MSYYVSLFVDWRDVHSVVTLYFASALWYGILKGTGMVARTSREIVMFSVYGVRALDYCLLSVAMVLLRLCDNDQWSRVTLKRCLR